MRIWMRKRGKGTASRTAINLDLVQPPDWSSHARWQKKNVKISGKEKEKEKCNQALGNAENEKETKSHDRRKWERTDPVQTEC